MTRIDVPEALVAHHRRWSGERGVAWANGLPTLAESVFHRWGLTADGKPMHGMVGLVIPVRRTDGTKAALKLHPIDAEHPGEGTALRVWDGRGAVLLLDMDCTDDTDIFLLERLDGGRMLDSVADIDDAVAVIAGLLLRLNAFTAPPGIPRLDDVIDRMVRNAPAAVAAQADPGQAKLLRRWADAVAGLRGTAGDRLLHWDLHYFNVLAGEREPWLAIDPKPLAGHPGFELLPALHNRWDDAVQSGHLHRAIRRRFDQMTEILGLDRREAVVWAYARILQNEIWYTEDGITQLNPKFVEIAQAIA